MDIVCRRVLIFGRVQGVWFRDQTRKNAVAKGLEGWVKNRVDGDSVEAIFQGPRLVVDEMILWCRNGPPLAHVERVEVIDCPIVDIAKMNGFEIRY